MKIEWDVDECTQLLPKPQKKALKEKAPPKVVAPVANRFELLNLGETEVNSLDDHDSCFEAPL